MKLFGSAKVRKTTTRSINKKCCTEGRALKKSNPLTIQPGIFIFTLYIAFFWICDIFDLIRYGIGISQGLIITRIFTGVIIFVILILLRSHIRLCKIKKDSFFYFASLFVVIFGIFKSIQPDTSADVMKYHLLAQGSGYVDSFINNLAPGDFQLMGFLLPDRLYLPFRLLLGYRAGTILNSLLMVLIYAQTTALLSSLLGEQLLVIRSKNTRMLWRVVNLFCRESVFAFIIVFFYDVVMQSGTYMVELAAIPLALESLRILLKGDSEKKDILFFALLNGIFFTIKMTNIVYIIPMVILFIIKNFKKLNLPTVSICAACCILPVSIYFIFNAVTTGNPVFPYFNTIFSSGYFNISNFKDTRWGPESLWELIFWPLYMVFKPEYRQSEIPNVWPYPLLIGFLFVFFVVIKWIRNKEPILKNKKMLLSIIFIVSFYLWAFTTGHNRYFMFGMIICGIFCFTLITRIITSSFPFKRIVVFLLSIIMAIHPVYSFYAVFEGREWSWRGYYYTVYKENLSYLLNDHNFVNTNTMPDIDMFLFLNESQGSLAYQLNPNAVIMSYRYVKNRISDAEKQAESLALINEYLQDEDKIVSDLANYSGLPLIIETANTYGVKIQNVNTLDTHFRLMDTIITLTYAPLDEGEENTVISAVEDDYTVTVNAGDITESITFEAIVGLNQYRQWFSETPICFYVEASDGDSSIVAYEQTIQEGEFYNISETLDLSGLTGEITISFGFGYDASTPINFDDVGPYRLLVINPTVN